MTNETPRRTVRVNDELWARATAAAQREGETITDVIRRALAVYADSPGTYKA